MRIAESRCGYIVIQFPDKLIHIRCPTRKQSLNFFFFNIQKGPLIQNTMPSVAWEKCLFRHTKGKKKLADLFRNN